MKKSKSEPKAITDLEKKAMENIGRLLKEKQRLQEKIMQFVIFELETMSMKAAETALVKMASQWHAMNSELGYLSNDLSPNMKEFILEVGGAK